MNPNLQNILNALEIIRADLVVRNASPFQMVPPPGYKFKNFKVREEVHHMPFDKLVKEWFQCMAKTSTHPYFKRKLIQIRMDHIFTQAAQKGLLSKLKPALPTPGAVEVKSAPLVPSSQEANKTPVPERSRRANF